MADNNVFVLFEEIKTALKGINNKLEELPKVVAQVPQSSTNAQDLPPIKEAVMEVAKAQSEDIKGMLAKHWKAYAQISTVILQHLDTIKQSQVKQGGNRNSTHRSTSTSTVSTSNQRKSFLLS